MHPQLIICLALSILAGLAAASAALLSGWSLYWALPIYSVVGATTLVASSLLAHLATAAFAARPRLAPQPEPVHA